MGTVVRSINLSVLHKDSHQSKKTYKHIKLCKIIKYGHNHIFLLYSAFNQCNAANLT